ncbi:MAG TPA: hypothetical protein PKJ45_02460 [Rubrivivax sp.]|nr:hypothetical protein [Burkholderiales bacterium]HNU10209.1 hypothetical protein [Rubrivivax sp.]
MKPARPHALIAAVLALSAWLGGCAGTPTPDWQINAGSALQRMQQALLQGNDRVATNEYQRARAEVASTGRPDLAARVELLRCAAWTASLQFGACEGFARLRLDAGPPELAYAAYLRGRMEPDQRGLLPPAQQALAVPPRTEAEQLAALQKTGDPLARLLAASLWLQAGQAAPAAIALAVDTASEQGWRRPLLAWLAVQQRRARDAGDIAEANRIGRRIELVLQGREG